MYRSIASAFGTPAALDLAHRLAAWHDAMVIHRRLVGDEARNACEADCPHDEAELLWLQALDVFGERAHQFAFLRTFGSDVAGSAQRLSELRG
jgi:hypothetical protein